MGGKGTKWGPLGVLSFMKIPFVSPSLKSKGAELLWAWPQILLLNCAYAVDYLVTNELLFICCIHCLKLTPSANLA